MKRELGIPQWESSAPLIFWERSDAEIGLCVMEADVLDDLAHKGFVGGHLSLFHLVAQEGAENPPEIVMARIGDERTAVGEHSQERSQVACGG